MEHPDYSIVIPVFRMREQLTLLIDHLSPALSDFRFEILLIDDSGNENVFEHLKTLCHKRPYVKVVKLIRNVGQHQAILCGLYAAQGERILTLDDDYRYTLESILELMKNAYQNDDFDVYYGVYQMNKPYDFARNLFFSFVKLFSTLPNKVPRNGSSVRIYRKEIAGLLTTLRYPVVFLDAMQLTYAKDFRYQEIVEVESHHEHASNYNLLHTIQFLTNLTLTYSYLPQVMLIFFALLSAGSFWLFRDIPALTFIFIFLFFTTAFVQISFKLKANIFSCDELIRSVYVAETPRI